MTEDPHANHYEIRVCDVAMLADIEAFDLFFRRDANADRRGDDLPENQRDSEDECAYADDADKLLHQQSGAAAEEQAVAGGVRA